MDIRAGLHARDVEGCMCVSAATYLRNTPLINGLFSFLIVTLMVLNCFGHEMPKINPLNDKQMTVIYRPALAIAAVKCSL